MLFDKFVNKTVITGKLIAVDPIHIGSSDNNTLDPTAVDNSVLKDSTGRAVIPGSSLKGVVRSYFESVVRAAYGKDAACDVFDNNNSCSEQKSTISDRKEAAEEDYKESCMVCKLFGGKRIAGKLSFKDSFSLEIPLYEHRDGVGINRETGAAARRRKYDFEIIPKGTEFDFCLIAENLDDEQEKQLNFIIKSLESKELTIGGKTTRGLGRFYLSEKNISRTTADDLREFLFI